MSHLDNWEFIEKPKKPFPVSQLEIKINEGAPLILNTKRPLLYERVLSHWEDEQVQATLARSEILSKALKNGNDKVVRRMTAQIGGVSQKARFCGSHLQGKKLYMSLSGTQFMDYVGTNMQGMANVGFRNELIQAGLDDATDPDFYFANPISVCALIYGFNNLDDDSAMYVPIGLRSDKVMLYPNAYHVIGGVLDANTERTEIDIERYIRQELLEEMGIEEQRMGSATFHGIVRNLASREPEFVLSIPVYLSQRRLIESWEHKSPGKFEHRNMTIYAFDQLGAFLEENGETMVPQGAAALHCFLEEQREKFSSLGKTS